MDHNVNLGAASYSGFDLLKKQERVFFQKKIELLLSTLELENLLLTIHLCGDNEIKSLNKRFRKKNKATDVLSFGFSGSEDDPFAKNVLGDIVISVETAKRQCDEGGHEFMHELCVLFVHGLLHLVGYDHERGPDEARLQAEAELFLLDGLDIPVETALISRHFSCPTNSDVKKSRKKIS